MLLDERCFVPMSGMFRWSLLCNRTNSIANRASLGNGARRQRLVRDDVVIEEGSANRRVFLVQNGVLRLEKRADDEKAPPILLVRCNLACVRVHKHYRSPFFCCRIE
jgi:hypothetical protein